MEPDSGKPFVLSMLIRARGIVEVLSTTKDRGIKESFRSVLTREKRALCLRNGSALSC